MHNAESPILIIAGMHRSGTSLTASALQSAGVNIGSRLVGANEGNIKGYFEDADFVQLHENILHSQGISKEGWTLQRNIQVQEQYIEIVKAILRRKCNLNQVWGWKDPRTTLFLKFWQEQLPEACFLLIYRSPWEVIDSLYRRGLKSDEIFYENPNFALQVWMNYNCALVDFYDHFFNKCLLLNIDSIISHPDFLIQEIKNKFKIALAPIQLTDIYEKSLFHSQISNSYRATLVKQYFPEALDLYKELDKRKSSIDKNKTSLSEELTKLPAYEVWAFQDWLDIRRKEKQLEQSQTQLHQTQTELEQSQTQLHQTQTELEQSQTQLHQTQTELEQSQTQLHQTQTELEQSQTQLHQTQTELEHSQTQLHQAQTELEQSQTQLHQAQTNLGQSQTQLHQTQTELGQSQTQLHQFKFKWQQAQTTITAMESSKFWKLRKTWFQLKRLLKLVEN